jgi:hypothetical protein
LASGLLLGWSSASFGGISYETWEGISGDGLSNLTSNAAFPDRPTRTGVLDTFNLPRNAGDNYGSRLRGYLQVPASGDYTFWLAADNQAELWLSSDDTADHKQRITQVSWWSGYQNWTKSAEQRSAAIRLEAGRRYYIEALHKEGTGEDHLAVAWSSGNISRQVIPGDYLTPWGTGSASTTGTAEPTATGKQGCLLREYWLNVSGARLTDLTSDARYPNNPSGTELITTFEGPRLWADNYGTRVRGYIHPPTTGNYTFWIAGDDVGELRLSTDENPVNARRIAYFTTWTGYRVWNHEATQRSAAIQLQGGKRYYVEVLHKEVLGGDNLSVAWSGPGINQTVIPGTYLSSWAATTPTPTDPTGKGTGLRGEYYDAMQFSSLFMTRTDPTINFDWGSGAPMNGMGENTFSVRWTGQVLPVHASGTQAYTFYVTGDDGVRLWVDGKLLVDRWILQGATTYSATVNLQAGRKYDIRLDYFENSVKSMVRLEWSTNGVSRRVIPALQLFPAAGGTPATDSDGDGVPDSQDAFPSNPNESLDTDRDGIGNNTDTDDDNDGLPDSWETQFNLNPLDAADASRDDDGDSASNLAEYQGGSDPRNANSRPAATDSVELQWTPPTTRTNGSALGMIDIGGYKIYYGTSRGQYSQVVTIRDAYTDNYRITGLNRGRTYYFAVSTFDKQQLEGPRSNEVSKNVP